MRVVILQPSEKRGQIANIIPEQLRDLVGGHTVSMPARISGFDLLVVTRLDADPTGAAPNRIVDGRLLHGTIVAIHSIATDLPILVARAIQNDYVWPMAQLEAHDKPA